MFFIKSNIVKYISFGFATAIALYPFVVMRSGVKIRKSLIIHEKIHLKQQCEMLILPFYIWYFVEYFIRLLKYKNHYRAYKNISFEQEAYAHENDGAYLKKRKFFEWMSYL